MFLSSDASGEGYCCIVHKVPSYKILGFLRKAEGILNFGHISKELYQWHCYVGARSTTLPPDPAGKVLFSHCTVYCFSTFLTFSKENTGSTTMFLAA